MFSVLPDRSATGKSRRTKLKIRTSAMITNRPPSRFIVRLSASEVEYIRRGKTLAIDNSELIELLREFGRSRNALTLARAREATTAPPSDTCRASQFSIHLTKRNRAYDIAARIQNPNFSGAKTCAASGVVNRLRLI